MELKHITYFVRVAELEHMSKAADDLFVSQPHLSRIISELEAELGVKLFDKDGRGIKLNSCGFVFYKQSLRIINTINDAKVAVLNEYQSRQFQLSVVTNAGAYMPGLLTALSLNYPTLKIKQFSAPRKQLIRMLSRDEVDFAICCTPILNDLQYTNLVLRHEPAVIIYPSGHWLEDRNEVSISELKNEDFIGANLGYGARDALEPSYSGIGFNPRFTIETADTSSIENYVLSGLGIAIVAKSLICKNSYFKYHYTNISEPAEGVLSISYRKDKEFNAAEKIFYNEAIEYYKNIGDET